MHSTTRFRTAALGCALGLQTVSLPAEVTGPEVLARSKQAHGGEAWDQVQTLAATAGFCVDGHDQPTPGGILEDLPNGRYQRSYGTGPEQVCWSFDGSRFWYRTGGGDPFTVSGPLRDQVARACAYMHARGFWFPDRFPASVEYLGLAHQEGDPCHVVRLTPAGALPVECRVDARSWRVRRIAWPMTRGLWCHTFADYRTVQGLLLPFRICCGWEKSDCRTEIRIERYLQGATLPAQGFRCQEQDPAEASPVP